MCEGCCLDESTIEDTYAVVYFVLLADTTQDTDRLRYGRFVDENLGEPPLECRVLLDVLAVFSKGRRTDAPELATGEQRLEQVGSVHAAALRATAGHNEVQLVDEENDARPLVRGLLDLVEDGLDTLLVLALVLRTGHERTHVERVEATEKRCGNVAVDDTLCETLCNGRFSYTGFTDEDGVVLCPERIRQYVFQNK